MIRQTSPLAAINARPPDEESNFRTTIKNLPSHLQTVSQCWSSLLMVTITGAFASGPVASWPTLEPLLISEGVWEGSGQQDKMTAVFSVSMGVTLVSVFLSGVLYDAIGPRALGAGGALGSAVCLLLMAVAIKVPALNDLLWVAYPLANACGAANSLDVYAWLWLLPGDQITISAIAGAIQCLSDSFILVGVFMNDHLHVPIEAYLILSAFLACVAAVVAVIIVPSRQMMHRISRAAARDQAAAETSSQGYGTTNNARLDMDRQQSDSKSEDDDDITVNDALSKSSEAIANTWVLVSKVHPGISLLFFVQSMAQYMFCVYPCFIMYPLYTELLGSEDATTLVNIFGGIYAFVGAASLLAFGQIVDQVGVWWSYVGVIVLMVGSAYFYSVPSMSVQVVGQVVLTVLSNVWYVYVPRFCTAYGPAELFGTMIGLIGGLLGVGQIILTQFGTLSSGFLIQVLRLKGPALTYLVTIDVWCFSAVVSALLLLWWWQHEPIPQAGSTTMADVQKAIDDDGTMMSRKLLGEPVKPATPPSNCLPCDQIFRKRPAAEDTLAAP